jgi:putative intracellular protease/amidase
MSLAYRNSKKHRAPAYILIGDGFDELEVIYFLHRFRQAGLPIKSVSLFNKLVFSRQGVGLKADYELAEHPVDPQSDCLVILPSGGRNGEMLRRDARVKSLLESIEAGNGRIAVTDENSHLAMDIEQLCSRHPPIQPYRGQGLEEFVDHLADRAAFAV